MYTELEVVEMLVHYTNRVMKALNENKKFLIKGTNVECWRTNRLLQNKLLSTYTFKYVIEEAGGTYRRTSFDDELEERDVYVELNRLEDKGM